MSGRIWKKTMANYYPCCGTIFDAFESSTRCDCPEDEEVDEPEDVVIYRLRCKECNQWVNRSYKKRLGKEQSVFELDDDPRAEMDIKYYCKCAKKAAAQRRHAWDGAHH